MAKVPVPGRAKTRLAAATGDEVAADLAAAALLDTIAAVDAAPGFTGHLALEGDLAGGARGAQLAAAVSGWTVTPQRGATFAERLVAAHEDAGHGTVLQIGMDTPQLTPDLLHGAVADLAAFDACLGPADDGGWWLLARRDPAVSVPLAGVAMSTPTTYDDTRSALRAAGHRVGVTAALRDVDTVADAAEVARLAPHTQFAASFREWEGRE
ncbi:glycosyltransferase [Nocardioides currus]|uniref:Glycosyltransferase n=2 Tax=Nocardioides currus TaxID=2133958 RepID=A0A2R7YSQ8_9ACTN|nr:glycosyltransferase [Nocardioides currus]